MRLLVYTMMTIMSALCYFGFGLARVTSFHPENDRIQALQTSSILIERDFHDTTGTNVNAFTVYNPNDNDHWSVRFSVFLNAANPLQATMAAHDLTQFYSAILAMARVVWARETPQRWRRASMGGLLLLFWSDSPIPWEFLSAFLTTMVSLIHQSTALSFVSGIFPASSHFRLPSIVSHRKIPIEHVSCRSYFYIRHDSGLA